MGFKKKELDSMAADLRAAVVDLKHHGNRTPQAIERIEKVMNELLIEAHICKE